MMIVMMMVNYLHSQNLSSIVKFLFHTKKIEFFKLNIFNHIMSQRLRMNSENDDDDDD